MRKNEGASADLNWANRRTKERKGIELLMAAEVADTQRIKDRRGHVQIGFVKSNCSEALKHGTGARSAHNRLAQ